MSHLITNLNKYFISTVVVFSLFLPVSAADYVIEVRGQGRVMAEPDVFTVQVTVSERGASSEKSKLRVDHKSNLVVNIAKKLGVKPKNITSAKISYRPIDDKPSIQIQAGSVNRKMATDEHGKVYYLIEDGKNGINNGLSQAPKAKVQKYELTRYITVKFDDVSDYDKFLAQIMKVGVNHISPLTMSINDSESHYQQALKQAVTHAKQKAQLLANQSNVKLGTLVSLTETSSNHYQPVYGARMMSMNESGSHNSQTGVKRITASVTARFAIDISGNNGDKSH